MGTRFAVAGFLNLSIRQRHEKPDRGWKPMSETSLSPDRVPANKEFEKQAPDLLAVWRGIRHPYSLIKEIIGMMPVKIVRIRPYEFTGRNNSAFLSPPPSFSDMISLVFRLAHQQIRFGSGVRRTFFPLAPTSRLEKYPTKICEITGIDTGSRSDKTECGYDSVKPKGETI